MNGTDFYIKQLQANAKAMEIIQKQTEETSAFMNDAINNLQGEERQGAIDLKKGIESIFEKAKSGNINLGEDLENLKSSLSKHIKNGSNGNK